MSKYIVNTGNDNLAKSVRFLMNLPAPTVKTPVIPDLAQPVPGTATLGVLEFFKWVDLEKWRVNLPVTGDRDKDIAALQKSLWRFVLKGSKFPTWGTPTTSDEHCGTLVWELSKSALESVDWDVILKLWGACMSEFGKCASPLGCAFGNTNTCAGKCRYEMVESRNTDPKSSAQPVPGTGIPAIGSKWRYVGQSYKGAPPYVVTVTGYEVIVRVKCDLFHERDNVPDGHTSVAVETFSDLFEQLRSSVHDRSQESA